MICGLWLLADDNSELAKIDLAPNLGQWRVQKLEEDEFVVGLHTYVVADDETVAD